MKDLEIVVFNDKSWVRLTEYKKLDEEFKQEKQSLAKRIYELQSDLSRAKSQIEKMRCCENCINYTKLFEFEGCDYKNLCNWRMDNEEKN